MFSITHRPSKFSEIIGQDPNVRVLKAITRSPETSPRSIVLEGQFGSGKTSLARIFARALNCKSRRGGEPCETCDMCRIPLDSSPIFSELDSATVGNVEAVREMRDSWSMGYPGLWRVVLFDEAHLISPQAQSALLKVLEEAAANVFFMFATTDVKKLLPTICSRSLELHFPLVPLSDVERSIHILSKAEGIPSDPEVFSFIARRSGGHVRNAHILLSKYNLLGKEEFLVVEKDPTPLIRKLYLAPDKSSRDAILTELSVFPMQNLKSDMRVFMLEFVRALTDSKFPAHPETRQLVGILGERSLQFFKFSSENWYTQSFEDTYSFAAAQILISSFLGLPSSR